MNPRSASLSRRDFFASFVPRALREPTATVGARAASAPAPAADGPTLAVIAGRHCLAYQGSFCSVCRERCPVAGAIVIERGLPRVDASLCNGCRICHDVCPAPTNAIRLVPNRAAKSTILNRQSAIP
jgi:Pyruvate/2-oxoacid:ferredoxin oxidoreductase delta subunit